MKKLSGWVANSEIARSERSRFGRPHGKDRAAYPNWTENGTHQMTT